MKVKFRSSILEMDDVSAIISDDGYGRGAMVYLKDGRCFHDNDLEISDARLWEPLPPPEQPDESA